MKKDITDSENFNIIDIKIIASKSLPVKLFVGFTGKLYIFFIVARFQVSQGKIFIDKRQPIAYNKQ